MLGQYRFMGRSSSAVYDIRYHIVWCPKYRKPILARNDVNQFTRECIETIVQTKGWDLIGLEIMPDHIHVFISTQPFQAPTDIVKILKGVTAKQLRSKFPVILSQIRKGSIWSPSYYVGTAGDVSSETIKHYIENQRRNSSTH